MRHRQMTLDSSMPAIAVPFVELPPYIQRPQLLCGVPYATNAYLTDRHLFMRGHWCGMKGVYVVILVGMNRQRKRQPPQMDFSLEWTNWKSTFTAVVCVWISGPRSRKQKTATDIKVPSNDVRHNENAVRAVKHSNFVTWLMLQWKNENHLVFEPIHEVIAHIGTKR